MERAAGKRRLDFIVIGAMRAGTTSLWRHLASHPAVYVPPEKEAPFFSNDHTFKRGLDRYFDDFFAAGPRDASWGTSTPQYMRGGKGVPVERIAGRIARAFPDIKLVAILRDPIERAISHYRLSVRRGHEARGFEEAIGVLLQPDQLLAARRWPDDTNAYVTCGEYGRILGAYREVIRPEQLLVTFTADLERDPAAVLARIYAHLGVDPTHVSPNPFARHNEGGTAPRVRTEDAATLVRYLDDHVWPQLPEATRDQARRAFEFWLLTWNVVPARAEPVETLVRPPVRMALREHFARDAESLIRLGIVAPWMADGSAAPRDASDRRPAPRPAAGRYVLYVTRSSAHFPYHEGVVRALLDAGHRVKMLCDRRWSDGRLSPGLEECRRRYPRLEAGWLTRRSDRWRPATFIARELRSFGRYARRSGQSPHYRDRWRAVLFRPLRPLVRVAIVRKLLATRAIDRALGLAERWSPVDRVIRDELSGERPDVIVASPMNMVASEEIEYVKAAQALGIPTVVPVLSWDNLTTKGLLHVVPDWLLAWNAGQRKAARTLHDVPADHILVTGAPFFDKWFAGPPTTSREEFTTRIGLDPARPYVAWLGSSASIATDESSLVGDVVAALRGSADPRLRGIGVLIRPHPANPGRLDSLTQPRVVVRSPIATTEDKRVPESPAEVEELACTLHFAAAVIGINTTGMIDAVICDRPTIALATPDYRRTQTLAAHFRELLRADVLDVATSIDELTARLAAVLDGGDARGDQRARFVRQFVRPHGLDLAAGRAQAIAIELVAVGCDPVEVRARYAEAIARATHGSAGPVTA